jgi:hypothetical protein
MKPVVRENRVYLPLTNRTANDYVLLSLVKNLQQVILRDEAVGVSDE